MIGTAVLDLYQLYSKGRFPYRNFCARPPDLVNPVPSGWTGSVLDRKFEVLDRYWVVTGSGLDRDWIGLDLTGFAIQSRARPL